MVSFIYGRSGSGKSDCLFSAAERTVSCGRHAYFLVPDREAVNAERSAAKRNLGADVDIITFTRLCDFGFKLGGLFMRGGKWHARELPFTPPFMDKRGGLVLSMGSFMTWASQKVMEAGLMVMPGTPVAEPLFPRIVATGI